MEQSRQNQIKKERFIHKFLHFYRNRVMNILIVLLVILYFILRLVVVIPQEMQRCFELLETNIEQAEKYEKYGSDANELYFIIQDQDYLSATQLFISFIQDGSNVQFMIDNLNSAFADNASAFYLKSNGTLISNSNRDPLTLTEDEYSNLLNDGYLQLDGDSVRYYALPNGNDCMIVRIDEANAEQFSLDVLKLVSLNGFIFNNKTLDIIESDEETIPQNLSQMYISEPIENDSLKNSKIELKLISTYNSGIQKYINMKLAAVKGLEYQNKNSSICVYIPIAEIISNVLVKSGLPTLLCLAFIALSIFASLHFRKVLLKAKISDDSTKVIKLPFNCYIDVKLAKHIAFMQLFLGVLIIFCSTILMTLNRFSLSYENAKYNLEQLATTEEACQEALDECWNMYYSPAIGMSGCVNNFLKRGDVVTDPDVQKNLTYLVDSTFLDVISIYNRDGECIYTTDDSVGYPLSTDPSNAQYSFWTLMDGDKQYILTRSDYDDGIIYCAMKRTDDVGIIVVTFSDQGFGALQNKLSSGSIVANVHYRNSCIFLDKNIGDDGTVTTGSCYQIARDGTRIICDNPDLPIISNLNSFCGFRTIGNVQYLVVGRGDTSRSSFYLTPMSDIIDGLSENTATYIIFLLIICFLVFLGCAVYTPETLEDDEEIEISKKHRVIGHNLIRGLVKRVPLSEIIADSQKTVWEHGLYSTIGLIVVTLLLDSLLNSNSIISFLFYGQWEKNVNLFSLSVIVLLILATSLVFHILKLFFEELIKNFPSQYAAPIQMIHSIVNIVIIIWLVVFSANEVGIDTTTILASVGISGLALGIAAKDTINDMLNGIFIILDGRIQVGDYVDIGGFYGQIVKIGIRTTKIKRFNQEKSINNSDMKNLLNYSKGLSSVYLQFRVAPDTDIPAMKKLIEDSSPRFQEACKGKLKGPVRFLGVESFDADSILCSLFVNVDEEMRKALIRNCNLALLEILNENGIAVGSNLVLEAENGRRVKVEGKKEKL